MEHNPQYLSDGAYKELVDDDHPVVVVSARDIARLIKSKIGGHDALQRWLHSF